MKRVFVTESGYYDEVGGFRGTGVIGVDFKPKSAIGFVVNYGFNRIGKCKSPSREVRMYKRPDSFEGVRITVIDAF